MNLLIAIFLIQQINAQVPDVSGALAGPIDLSNALGSILSTLGEVLGEENVPEDLKQTFLSLKNTVDVLIDNVEKLLPNLPPNVIAALNTLQSGVGSVLVTLAETLKQTVLALGGPSNPASKDAVQCLLVALKPVLKIVAKVLDAVLKVVIAALPKDGVTITTTPASGLGGIIGIVTGAVSGATGALGGQGGLLNGGLTDIVGGLVGDLTGTVGGITKCLKAILPLPLPVPLPL